MPPQIENQIPPTENPIQPEPSHSHTQLILLTVAMILVGILAVGYFVYQNQETSLPVETQNLTATTTDQFADWKTYRNEEYGFEFKLPPKWKDYKVEENESNILLFSLPFLEASSTKHHIIFDIEIWKKTTTWKNDLENIEVNRPIYVSENDNFVFLYGNGQDDGSYVGFENYDARKTQEGPFWELRNKILPTFKFISTSTPMTIDTSNWKIGGGDALGFTILIPQTAEQKLLDNPLTEPHGDFYIENSTKDALDYFYLLMSKESDFGLDENWKEEKINLGGTQSTALVQKNEKYNRILINLGNNKFYGQGNKNKGWFLLLRALESFKKL